MRFSGYAMRVTYKMMRFSHCALRFYCCGLRLCDRGRFLLNKLHPNKRSLNKNAIASYRIKVDLEDRIMQYQLFVQNQAERGFLASVIGGMPVVNGEGVTPEEAIAQAKTSLQPQLATGKFIKIQVDSAEESIELETDPWLKHLGLFANDPTFDDFLDEVAAYRHQVDEESYFM
jgi:hypothetical protein